MYCGKQSAHHDGAVAHEQVVAGLGELQPPTRHAALMDLWKEVGVAGDLHPSRYSESVVVIPASGGSGRSQSLISSLISLSRQVYGYEGQHVSKVFIGDNGLSRQQKQEISEVGQGLNVPICIVDALPTNNAERNAAHARNRAIRRLVMESAFNESLRGDVLLFDDDVAFQKPDALAALRAQMVQTRAGEASQLVAIGIPTEEVEALTRNVLDTAWSRRVYRSRNVCSSGALYPPIWDVDGHVEFSNMVAFGRECAAKTNALYVKRSVLHEVLSRVEQPFIVMPHGSFEDMWLNIGISRWGVLAKAAEVSVLDQVRVQEEELCRQQAKWARDHSIAAGDLAALNKLSVGFTVLEPDGNSFRQWGIPPLHTAQGVLAYGVLVNPASLMQSIRFIEGWRTTAPIADLIGADVDEERFTEVLQDFKDIVASVLSVPVEQRQQREHTQGSFPERILSPGDDDLPFIRFRPRVRAARLAGNIAGLIDVESALESPIAHRIFVGGTREPVWPRM